MPPARSLKALFVDMAPPRAEALSRVLDHAGWRVTAREESGADGLAAALLERGWDAVLYGGDGNGHGVPARKALALVRLADPHLPFLAVSPSIRPDDLATVVQGVEGIVFAEPETLPERLDDELSIAARRRDEGVTHPLLHAQQSIADLLAIGLEPAELLERVLEALGGALGWAFGAVWQPAGDPPELRAAATWQRAGAPAAVDRFAELTRDACFAPGRGLPGRVWAFRRPVWTSDVRYGSTTPRGSWASEAGFGSATAFPVVAGDECVAVIELWGEGTREHEPDVAALLATAGVQLGHAFERDRAATAALGAERRRWQRYLDLTGGLVVELDRDGRIVHASRSTCDLLGLPEQELAGRDWFALAIPAHERAGARRAFAARLAGPDDASATDEERGLLASDGETRTIAWRHVALHDDEGAVAGTLSSGEDVTGRRRTEQQITYLAYHDALTGLANRTLLEEHLELALARARRTGAGVAVLHADLDGFKLVNDSLGHTAGDELLCRVAARVREALRATDLLARVNGDEFLVLLADLAEDPVEVAQTAARKMLAALARPFEVKATQVHVGASIGIATAPEDADDPEALLSCAETAMHRAKTGARGGWTVYAGGPTEDPLRRLSLTGEMRRALAEGELSLHYQPIHAVGDRRIVGLEALLRWKHPERGWIPPGEFIPLAEETGLIEDIGDWVVRAVCEQQADWAARGLRPIVSFNVSPRQFRRLDFIARITEHLRATGADAARLVVEITESSTLQDPAAAEPVLRELHALGLGIALDDFGTGYSSLSRLRALPVATLKIDRAFLRDIPHDREAAAIVTAVLRIARALGRNAVAEGVETEEQLAFLAAEGCPLAQGFLFARPLPPAEAEALLAAGRATAAT